MIIVNYARPMMLAFKSTISILSNSSLSFVLVTAKVTMYLQISDKVEGILKGSLDLIPSSSTSVKIQIMGFLFSKVC